MLRLAFAETLWARDDAAVRENVVAQIEQAQNRQEEADAQYA